MKYYKKYELKTFAIFFLVTLLLSLTVLYNKRSIAQGQVSSIPSSGNCALLMTLPIPYGFNVAANVRNGVQGNFQTGYNLIGRINFLNSGSGSFSGQVINPTFNTSNSPVIESAGGVVNLQNMAVTISPMTNSNGFEGGYTFTFSGTLNGSTVGFRLVGVPTNGGNTIVMVSVGSGTLSDPGIGPASGVCQV